MDENEIIHILNESLQNFVDGRKSIEEFEIFNNMSINSVPMSLNSNVRLYRVRDYYSFKQHNIEKDNIYNVTSFSYPPKGHGGLSRAATKDFPLFYASSTHEAAIEECKLSNNLFYLSTWSVNNIIKIRPFLSNIPKNILNNPSLLLKEINEKLKEKTSDHSSEDQKFLDIMDNFHDQNFLNKNPDIYKYTSWLGYRNLYYSRIKKLSTIPDAIVYQSVIDHNLGTNFAIHPDFVDKHLKLEEVYLVYLNQDLNRKHCSIISKGNIINHENIEWESLNTDQMEETYNKFL